MSVENPIFAFEKENQEMFLIESEKRVLYHVVAIDIENDEYVFWDATGKGVHVSDSVGTWKGKLNSVSVSPALFPLHNAFQQYVASLGNRGLSVADSPLEVWQRIQDHRKQSDGTIRRGID